MKGKWHKTKQSIHKGFTLIEMVVVIVVLGIVGIGMSNFVGLGAEIYTDAVGREQVLSQTRFAMERLTREIREALPNSVRVTMGTGPSVNVNCVEFVPILASSTYVNVPVAPEAASRNLVLVQHGITNLTANKMVVYPLTSNDIYGTDATASPTGNIFSFTNTLAAGTAAVDFELTNIVTFDADSPTQRYYLVNNALSYCIDTSTGQLRRYANYWPPTTGQQAPPTGVTGVLMAENMTGDTTPFKYDTATLVSNAVIKFTFKVIRAGEQIDFHHEVHLINVP